MRIGAFAGLAFMHIPVLIIILYAFTTEDRTYQFPPPGLTLHWFEVAFGRADIWQALSLSLGVAACATALALVLGTLAAFALARAQFSRQGFAHRAVRVAHRAARHHHRHRVAGRHEARAARRLVPHHRRGTRHLLHRDRLQQRHRATAPAAAFEWVEASMDLGADGTQTLRYVLLPQVATAFLAGGMLAFALSFDEIIVTIFTAGKERTLPIWFFNELFRPRDRPVTNVVAVIVIAVTLIPILLAYYLTRPDDEHETAR